MANVYHGSVRVTGLPSTLLALLNRVRNLADVIYDAGLDTDEDFIPAMLVEKLPVPDDESRVFSKGYATEKETNSLIIFYKSLNTTGETFWRAFCERLGLTGSLSCSDETGETILNDVKIQSNTPVTGDVDEDILRPVPYLD